MISAFTQNTSGSSLQLLTDNSPQNLHNARWLDLLEPTQQEQALIEQLFNITIPTREKMQEIELSSRLYKEDANLFMTTMMIAHSGSTEPKYEAVSFILTEDRLITIRYIEPQAFALFQQRLKKLKLPGITALDLLMILLDVVVDRLADILELIGARLDDYSTHIFSKNDEQMKKLNYHHQLRKIGITGELASKTRESLVTFNRLFTFLHQNILKKEHSDTLGQLDTLSKDINALSDHVNFLSNKINFLLDATLGLVNIEQNNIIKIFSVAAVIFLPPTLIASIYGMNFKFMPELSWHWGYPLAIGMMLLSAWLPYKLFKKKKWL